MEAAMILDLANLGVTLKHVPELTILLKRPRERALDSI
jgi:hypothetical protein